MAWLIWSVRQNLVKKFGAILFLVVACTGFAAGSEPIYPIDEVDRGPGMPEKTREGTLQYPALPPHYSYPVTAVLAVAVSSDGQVFHAELVQTSEKAFGEESSALVTRWTVKPAQKHGAAVSCATLLFLRGERDEKARSIQLTRQAWFKQPKSFEDGKKK